MGFLESLAKATVCVAVSPLYLAKDIVTGDIIYESDTEIVLEKAQEHLEDAIDS